jgi:putative transposase
VLIRALAKEHDVSISALCGIFKMPRSSFYYKHVSFQEDSELVSSTKDIFVKNDGIYGARRIKVKLSELGYNVSRSRIRRIMTNEGLVSKYTKTSFRPSSTNSIKTDHPNVVKQEFDNRDEREVLVSDTTYLRINGQWHYLSIISDLCGRYIEGYASSSSKDAELTKKAILSIKGDLREIGIFHSDKGCEFLNKLVDKMLRAFEIRRSTSGKGNVYDNAVAEAMFKTIKTEFVKNRIFTNLDEFNREFSAWVVWYNNERIHSSLGYLTPGEYRKQKKDKKTANLYEQYEAI